MNESHQKEIENLKQENSNQLNLEKSKLKEKLEEDIQIRENLNTENETLKFKLDQVTNDLNEEIKNNYYR